jgi:hypothetical protein
MVLKQVHVQDLLYCICTPLPHVHLHMLTGAVCYGTVLSAAVFRIQNPDLCFFLNLGKAESAATPSA